MFEKFYKDWEQRLIDTGLIGNKGFMSQDKWILV